MTTLDQIDAHGGGRESGSAGDARPAGGPRAPRGDEAVRLYVDERIAPDERALEQLRRLSRVGGVVPPVVALPDVHYKARNPAPTGTVVAFVGGLVPLALDAGLNCGMRVHLLDLARDELDRARIEALFTRIRELVPIGWHREPVLTPAELDAVLARGAAWVVDRRDGRGGPVERIENGGVIAIDPAQARSRRAVPPQLRRRARRGLGVLGSGNHFLELHAVEELLDPRAQALGLEAGRLLFMLHSGSGVVGKTLGLFWGARDETVGARQWQFLLEKLAYHATAAGSPALKRAAFRKGVFTLYPEASRDGRRYAAAVALSANYGYANRAALGAAIERAVADVLGVERAPLLSDVSHALAQREEHGGRQVWVHRQGASRAYPGDRLAPDGPFAAAGQPFPVPGSMATDAFVCVAGERAGDAFYSANHGAGRVLDKPEARRAFSDDDVRAELEARSILLFRGGPGSLEEQAPGAFKDVDAVIDSMRATRLAAPVARTRPLAVLKG